MLKQLRQISLAVAVLGLGSGAWAEDPPPGTLITDPAKLAALGFGPGEIVYVANPTEARPDAQNFGVSDPIMYTHSGLEFRGRSSTYAYTDGGGIGGVAWAGGDIFADAQLHLPSGAVWENSRAWVNLPPNMTTNISMLLLRSCQPANGPGVPVFTILASGSILDGTGEHSFMLPAGTVIDNNSCLYWNRVLFTRVGSILRKVRTQYRLQVSPGPAVATFPNDVPTTHPLFRFVEALAASGVSGGCAAGSYCPDSPITRGQMAVFLSVALGLHFPN